MKYAPAATGLLLLLAACSREDENSKALEKGALQPPWDSPSFTPRELESKDFDQPESTFFVFQVIGMIDSLSGERSTWKVEEGAVDTITLAMLFDSAFVFLASPTASLPYAYDDSYRDDTLYRHFYGNGLFTQDHPCAETFLITDPFLHPARWLKAGLKQEEIRNALGTPSFSQQGVLRYFSRREPAPPAPAPGADSATHTPGEYEAHEVLEGVNFYFMKDSLFAAVLHRSQPCH